MICPIVHYYLRVFELARRTRIPHAFCNLFSVFETGKPRMFLTILTEKTWRHRRRGE